MIVIYCQDNTLRERLYEVCARMGERCVGLQSAESVLELLRMNAGCVLLVQAHLPQTDWLIRELRSFALTATMRILCLGDKSYHPTPGTAKEDQILAEPDGYIPFTHLESFLEVELQQFLSPAEEEPVEQAAPSDQKILLIDDSLTYRMQLRDALQKAGYDVVLAETGEAGLEAALRGTFAAVLVDNMLPGIQGPAVIRRLRAEAMTRRVPCVLLTASEDPETELDALDAGADTFVRKDESTHTILLRLAAILRATSAPAAFQYASVSVRRVLLAGPRARAMAELRESLLADGVVLMEETEQRPEHILTRVLREPMDAAVLMLPHLEAVEVCRRMKEMSRLAQMRVLVVSYPAEEATDPSGVAERQAAVLQAGADDYVPSTLPVRNLRARLDTQLRRKQMEDENRALHDHLLRQQVEAESQRNLAVAKSRHTEEMRVAKEATEVEAREAQSARYRLEKVMEALPQMILMASATGNLLSYNRRWMQYTGEPMERHMPTMWRQCVHPEDVDRFLAERDQAMQRDAGFAGEYRLRSANGEYRWFYIQLSPLAESVDGAFSVPLGQQVRWLSTCTDINDRKLAEETLRRTEKLAATGRLAASIAHEINNPLEAVTNLLFLAEHSTRAAGGSVHEFVVSAQKELGRVSEIAKKTLTFYRESKTPAPVDLRLLVHETRDVYASRLHHQQISLEIEILTDLQPIGMSGELRQVVSNLVANAIDASPQESTVRMRVHASHHRVTGRPGVRIVVADHGDGILPSLRGELFKPFITTKGQNGTGLGLWVATSIAARHEGELRFWSSCDPVHHGTCFSFFLPLDGRVQMADDSISEMMRQIGSELLHK